jgi:hypothetical protein
LLLPFIKVAAALIIQPKPLKGRVSLGSLGVDVRMINIRCILMSSDVE